MGRLSVFSLPEGCKVESLNHRSNTAAVGAIVVTRSATSEQSGHPTAEESCFRLRFFKARRGELQRV